MEINKIRAGFIIIAITAWLILTIINFKIYMIILLLGLMFNFLALAFNGWKMPVKTKLKRKETAYHKYYTNNKKVKLWFLTDIIATNFKIKKKRFIGVHSIGDFIIYFGIILNIISVIWKI